MCNFGFQRLRLVNPYDLAFREARSAVGASALLTEAEVFKTVADAVADCTLVVGATAIGHRQLQHPLETVAAGATTILEEIRSPKETRRVAILFGSEKFGLSNEDLSHCNWLMHVPTGEEQPSMNLGQAVAVCLYELVRGSVETASEARPALASAGELERMTALLLEALYASGYIGKDAPKDKEEAVRRLIRRLSVPLEDVTVWLGMLRQIAWKLREKR
jgi:TrmH family RNA methyltransferase